MSDQIKLAESPLNEPSRALRPDAQAFDEIRIVTVPRYKMSGLSGDEWRISAEIQFLRKGTIRHRESYRDVQTACGFLYAEHGKACDDGHAYFAGEGNLCDQEGCKAEATHRHNIQINHCDHCGVDARHQFPSYRLFCDEHKIRGDCGIDDADRNYEVVEIA